MASLVKYSIIVPVFNRPHEIDELLQSLTHQSYGNFEVLIIEDGSTETCESVYERYTQQLQIRYFFKPNSGPGPSRNFGYQHARGDYFIVFDSDCIVPPEYLSVVDKSLQSKPLDAWGGPDRGHKDFTLLQQAMAFTMSSVITTGGIRGGSKANESFQPRSFNMGISQEVYSKTDGFKFDRFAEDIEFSIRIKKAGFRIGLIPEAYVFHKRRTSLQQFYRQVFNFGRGRVLVGRAHSDAIRITHWFPAFFVLGLFFMLPMLLFWPPIGLLLGGGYVIYAIVLAIFAFRTTQSLRVTLLAIPSAFVQLIGYGFGFLKQILS
ncbi:MAG: glycosyltransferase [Cyclobacteriaceae bacterium]|nr:glycosyltransferase [Cyclobacteriaceae bacterium]